MKFFIPDAPEAKDAEMIYEKTKAFSEIQLGGKVKDRRIFSIEINEKGKSLKVEVGGIAPNGQPVIAILDAGNFLVCTPNNGVINGLPAIVSAHDVLSVVEFDS